MAAFRPSDQFGASCVRTRKGVCPSLLEVCNLEQYSIFPLAYPTSMDRKYDLFEKSPDGLMMWKGTVAGVEDAIGNLQRLAAASENECCVMYLPDKAVIATMNTSMSPKASIETVSWILSKR